MRENQSTGFPTRSDINRPVQSWKQARGLKFWLGIVLSDSENKGADQRNCEADLRLCFRIGKSLVSHIKHDKSKFFLPVSFSVQR